ncbi:MAG: hypothetical protein AAGA54_31505 [Myxococcota bacterium]
MTAPNHDYQLGTLDAETLQRDEHASRDSERHGDERRWMILGGAGTLAILTALTGSIVLSGSGEAIPAHASLASLRGATAAAAAHLSVGATPELEAAPEVEPEAALKPARVATRSTALAAVAPAAPQAEPKPAPAPGAEPAPAAPKPADPPKPAPASDAEVSFSDLPSLPSVADAEPESEPEAPNFEADDDPFEADANDDGPGDEPETAAAPSEPEAAPQPEAAPEPEADPEPAAVEPEPEAAPEPAAGV